jgi:hypothetical protein
VNEGKCGSIGVSFGLCGGSSLFYMGTVTPIYKQAATQGQSIFIATGDEGAAGIVLDPTGTTCVVGSSRNINELGGDERVTDVGGTMFTPNFVGNNNFRSVPESAWNALYTNLPRPRNSRPVAGPARFIPSPPLPLIRRARACPLTESETYLTSQ